MSEGVLDHPVPRSHANIRNATVSVPEPDTSIEKTSAQDTLKTLGYAVCFYHLPLQMSLTSPADGRRGGV